MERYERRNDRPEPPEGWKDVGGKWKDVGNWRDVGKAWVDVGKAWKDGKTEPSDLEKIIGEAPPNSACLIQWFVHPAAKLRHTSCGPVHECSYILKSDALAAGKPDTRSREKFESALKGWTSIKHE